MAGIFAFAREFMWIQDSNTRSTKKIQQSIMKASTIAIIFFFFSAFLAVSMAQPSSPEETCIRRNLGRGLAPGPAGDFRRFKNGFPVDALCGDVARALWYFVRLNGKFPPHYVKAMCNVFGGDDGKVKAYVEKRWLGHVELLHGFSCASSL
ncbi:PREDICTED: uncharacterized protein LOC104812121 [Tarenaya hassleriana]|uniref:uncharacterized protein LOC104812121 n=1 Tax=Tarenaya hassleriana TaxID=28532 RepID=UPI00053C1DF9|nr:PREDICTED: uncharacterized protein LOC104812121 [Tarenaya hassleriana]XP_010537420.1 PREDICTED: uncharacterized protein LOC104812121 [Tarenaya hassleriana]